MANEKCFLCSKVNCYQMNFFEHIESCQMPSSQKPVKFVLQHLANCIKTKLVFQPGACICSECFKELSEYDNLMLSLLSFQKRLTLQLRKKINEVAEPEVINMAMTAEEEGQMLDAFNPELDAKEELIEVDDSIIDDTEVIAEVSDEDDMEVESDGTSGNRRSIYQECVICGTTFKSKLQLQNHITEVHNPKTYTCNICGAVRRDEEYLELHMNLHEGKSENECRYCPKRFSRPVNTLRHMRKHWDKKKFQCEKCGECFSLDNMLYNHRLCHEAEENPLICSVCNQSFKSRKTFNHHVLIHQENRPRHHCNLCSKSFTERYTLKMHMKTHGNNLSPAEAPVLEEHKNETESAVTALVSKFDDNTSTEFSCVICTSKFDNKDSLERHLQHEHDVILK